MKRKWKKGDFIPITQKEKKMFFAEFPLQLPCLIMRLFACLQKSRVVSALRRINYRGRSDHEHGEMKQDYAARFVTRTLRKTMGDILKGK